MSPTPKSFSLAILLIVLVLGVAGCSSGDPPQPTSTTISPLPATSESSDGIDSPNNSANDQPGESTDTIADNSDTENMLAAVDPPKPPTTKSTTPKPQPGKTIDMTFDDIKFDIEADADFERSMLPQPIEDLKKQKIRIGGYILPGFQSRDIKQFVLVRDNMECCFGPGAALYDCILVEMNGRGVDFTVRPVTVEGEFTIQEYKDGEGKVRAIYHLQGTHVR